MAAVRGGHRWIAGAGFEPAPSNLDPRPLDPPVRFLSVNDRSNCERAAVSLTDGCESPGQRFGSVNRCGAPQPGGELGRGRSGWIALLIFGGVGAIWNVRRE